MKAKRIIVYMIIAICVAILAKIGTLPPAKTPREVAEYDQRMLASTIERDWSSQEHKTLDSKSFIQSLSGRKLTELEKISEKE